MNLLVLTPEQQEALDLAKLLETRAEALEPFAPGRSALRIAAKSLRSYVAETLQ